MTRRMNFWKRFGSLCMAAALVLALLPQVPAQAGEPVNLVNNPGFENSDILDAWGFGGLTGDSTPGDARTGSNCVQLSYNVERYVFSNISASYEKEAAVTAGIWVKLEEPSDYSKVRFVLECKGGSNLEVYATECAEWQELKIEAEAHPGVTGHVIKAVTAADVQSQVYFDDPFFESADKPSENLVNNPGFENSNILADWGASGIAGDDTPDHVRTGYHCIQLSNQVEHYGFSGISATYDREAAVTAGIWVKLADASDYDKVRFVLECKGGGPDAVLSVAAAESTEWQELKIDAPARPGTTEHVIKVTVSAGAVENVYFDDPLFYAASDEPGGSELDKTPGVSITGQDGVNLVNNQGFEVVGGDAFESWGSSNVLVETDLDLTHSGANAAKITAGAGGRFAFSGLNAKYDRNATVTAGIWVNLTNETDYDKVQLVLERKEGKEAIIVKPEEKTGWQFVSATGQAVEGCTEHVIKYEVTGEILGDVYFDDPYVATSALESIEWLRNGGFENGTDAWGNVGEHLAEGGRSGKALRMDLSSAPDYHQATAWWNVGAPKYDGSADMVFSAWVKSVDGNGEFRLRVERKYEEDGEKTHPSQEQNFQISETETEWRQVSIEVPAQTPLKETLFHLEKVSGSGVILIDDVSLTLKDTSEPPEPPVDWAEYDSGLDRTLGTAITGENGINLLANPGFEWSGKALEAWGPDEAVTQTDTLFTHSGARSMEIGAGSAAPRNAFNGITTGYDKNAEVTAGVWVFLKNTADADKVKLILKRKDVSGNERWNAEAVMDPTGATLGWQKFTVTAPALGEDGDCVEQVLVMEVADGTADKIYLDDFFVLTAEPGHINWLRNGGFEKDKGGWNSEFNNKVREGAGRAGYALPIRLETFSLPSDYVNGDYTFQANGWWGASNPPYDGRTDMTYSVWAKSGGGSGQFQLYVERKYDTGSGEALYPDVKRTFTVSATDTEWKEYFIHVPAINGPLKEALFHIRPVSGRGVILLDDANLNLKRDIEWPEEPAPSGRGSSLPSVPKKDTQSTESKIPGTVVTGMPGGNAITNPGFEKGGDGWQLSGSAQTVRNAGVSAHSGGSLAAVVGKGEMTFRLDAWQDKNAAMTFSAWVFLTDPADADKVTVGLNRGTEIVSARPKAQSGWQRVEVTLPMSSLTAMLTQPHTGVGAGAVGNLAAAQTGPITAKITVGSGAKTVYVDDLFVTRNFTQDAQFVSNSDLEQLDSGNKSVSHWGLMPGWETVPGAIVTDSVQSGKYAVRIPQADVERALLQSSNWIDKAKTPLYDPSTPMLLTAWLKYENVDAQAVWLKAERKYNGGTQAVNTLGEALIGSSDGYVKVELYVPSEKRAFDEILVGVVASPGTGTVWVDNISFAPTALRETEKTERVMGESVEAKVLEVSMLPQSGSNLAVNPGFEQGDEDWGFVGPATVVKDIFHEGTAALKADKDAHIWNVVVEMNKDQALALSFWVKLTDPADAEKVQFFADRKDDRDNLIMRFYTAPAPVEGWQQVTAYIPAENDFQTTNFVLGMDTAADLAGFVYLDDYCLTYAAGVEEVEEVPAYNYIDNGSFERGEQTADCWGTIPNWGTRVNLTNDAYKGERALTFTLDGEQSTNIFQSSVWSGRQPYDPSKPATLTAWVKLENVSGDGVRVKLERKWHDTLLEPPMLTAALTGSTDGWQQIELYLPPTGKEMEELVVGIEAAPGQGQIWVDDVRLVETEYRFVPGGEQDPEANVPTQSGNNAVTDGNVLKNPGMEEINADGSATHWDVWPGNPAEGKRESWSSTDVKHSGERSVAIQLVEVNGQAIYQYRVPDDDPFPFNQDYIFSAWMKMENVTGTVNIGVKRRGADGKEYNISKAIQTGTSDWTRVELPAPKAGSKIVQYDVIFDIGSGSGIVYFDDFALRAADLLDEKTVVSDSLLKNPGAEDLNPDGTVTHWDVWPGNPAEGKRKSWSSTDVKHSGERSVAIELVMSNPQAIYQYRVPDDDPFPFNQGYIFSAWVKMENVTGTVNIGIKRRGVDGEEYNIYKTIEMGTYDWTLIELEAPKADVEIVQYDVIFDMGSGTGTIYLDDFDLLPADLEPAATELSFIDEGKVPAEEEAEPVVEPEPQAREQGGPAFPVWAVAVGTVIMVCAAGGGVVIFTRGGKNGRKKKDDQS